jgi:hypothetical protein
VASLSSSSSGEGYVRSQADVNSTGTNGVNSRNVQLRIQWRPNDMVSLDDYAGREQSYVKHVFLESYLEALVHKTASKYSHIVYVDGFAGPWQSANERFQDTSFGIALNALRRAKGSWKEIGAMSGCRPFSSSAICPPSRSSTAFLRDIPTSQSKRTTMNF